MACFIVPGAEAVITTAAQKILEHHEKRQVPHLSFAFQRSWAISTNCSGAAPLSLLLSIYGTVR